MEEMEKASKVDEIKGMGIRDKFKVLFDFIQSLVGKENAVEILGSENLDEVDLCEVTLTFKKIIDAYDKPLEDYSSQKSFEKLNNIPIEKIVSLANVAKEMPQSK